MELLAVLIVAGAALLVLPWLALKLVLFLVVLPFKMIGLAFHGLVGLGALFLKLGAGLLILGAVLAGFVLLPLLFVAIPLAMVVAGIVLLARTIA